jgi:hypothetical protein
MLSPVTERGNVRLGWRSWTTLEISLGFPRTRSRLGRHPRLVDSPDPSSVPGPRGRGNGPGLDVETSGYRSDRVSTTRPVPRGSDGSRSGTSTLDGVQGGPAVRVVHPSRKARAVGRRSFPPPGSERVGRWIGRGGEVTTPPANSAARRVPAAAEFFSRQRLPSPRRCAKQGFTGRTQWWPERHITFASRGAVPPTSSLGWIER